MALLEIVAFHRGINSKMAKTKRGSSPNTRKAVAAANLRRKVDRLRNELSTISKEESDRLLTQSPILLRAIFLLQEVGESESAWSDRASELEEDLRTLLVEQAHKEAIAQGVIQVGDSYIV